MKIYCCGCGKKVKARLTTGFEVYRHRFDLYQLPFWICDTCKNYVGCHHKTTNPTHPLGNIPTREIRNARQHIHRTLDPLWKGGIISRKEVYKKISAVLGKKYHTAEIASLEEARAVYKIVNELRKELNS